MEITSWVTATILWLIISWGQFLTFSIPGFVIIDESCTVLPWFFLIITVDRWCQVFSIKSFQNIPAFLWHFRSLLRVPNMFELRLSNSTCISFWLSVDLWPQCCPTWKESRGRRREGRFPWMSWNLPSKPWITTCGLVTMKTLTPRSVFCFLVKYANSKTMQSCNQSSCWLFFPEMGARISLIPCQTLRMGLQI